MMQVSQTTGRAENESWPRARSTISPISPITVANISKTNNTIHFSEGFVIDANEIRPGHTQEVMMPTNTPKWQSNTANKWAGPERAIATTTTMPVQYSVP